MFFSTRSYFVDWLCKLKVHRVNYQTISLYHVRFSTDIVNNNNIFFLHFFFAFFSIFFSFFCFLFLCVCFLFETKIYMLIHIRLCGRVTNENIFTRPFSENKTSFFLTYSIYWPPLSNMLPLQNKFFTFPSLIFKYCLRKLNFRFVTKF